MAPRIWVAYSRIRDIPAAALLRLRGQLPQKDRHRLARIHSHRRRREFLAARWLLGASQLVRSATGAWRHSLSHSGGWVACALVRRGRLGIDIEPIVDRDFSAVGSWAFPDDAVEPWRNDEPDPRKSFYRRWTRYEARIKAGDSASLVERTWFIEGIALSISAPWSLAVQVGTPRRWHPTSGFVTRPWLRQSPG